MWEEVDSLSDAISDSWKRGNNGQSLANVVRKLQSMQKDLKMWSMKDFCSLQNKIRSLRSKLKWLWSLTPSAATVEKIKQATRELDEMLLREEIMWRQRSRVKWLREGAKNT